MEKMFVDAVDDGNNVVLLKNYQTFKNHAMTEIILHSETKQIINDVFAEFFKFGMQLDRGLPASEHGPAFMPFSPLANGDMSLLHKVTCHGGACKVMHHFCMCCECHGDEDMFAFLTGDEVSHLSKKWEDKV